MVLQFIGPTLIFTIIKILTYSHKKFKLYLLKTKITKKNKLAKKTVENQETLTYSQIKVLNFGKNSQKSGSENI